MKYAILLTGFLVCIAVSTNALEKVDYKCIKNCTAQGLTYSYCYSSCLYDDYAPYQQQRPISEPSTYQAPQKSRIDKKCLNDCKDRGYVDEFCRKQCSS